MMSPSAVRAFAVIYCSVIAYCNADIIAYVKQQLTSVICVSVPQIHDVCNIDWKLRESDAGLYNEMIQNINGTISSKELYRGLSAGEAMHCKKMYENMMCRNTFPVCDIKRMVVDHGDVKARCEFARAACTTISIEGCEHATDGQEQIISELNKCEAISSNTSKLCPDTQVKVPKRYNGVFAEPIVERLAKIAEMFTKELKNHSDMARCEMKYREVLCRLIDACSPDGFYYLHYINIEECEEMISCVKSAGFSEEITSVCSTIPSTEDADEVTVPNPYVQDEIALLTTTATPATSEKIDHSTKKMAISTDKEVSDPTTSKEMEATSETLIETSEENKMVSNNTISKKIRNHGNASKNYQNLYLFTMAFTLLIGHTVDQLRNF